jgi:hypothetical protein
LINIITKCTWVDCQKDATKPQIARDGQKWANLCEMHDRELEEALKAGVPKVLSAWVKAQGGSTMASERMIKMVKS